MDTPAQPGTGKTAQRPESGAVLVFSHERQPDGKKEPSGAPLGTDMRSAAREALAAAQALGRHLGALLRVAAARGLAGLAYGCRAFRGEWRLSAGGRASS